MNRTAKNQMENLLTKDVIVQPSGFIYIDIECNTEWSLSSDLCSRCAVVMCNVHPLFHYLFTSHHSDQYCHTTLHKIYPQTKHGIYTMHCNLYLYEKQ